MFDLDRLSPEQRAVVLAEDGPLLVVAGPGSGKTTTIAARVAYLIEVRGVPPASVLVITFTTNAAHALRARLTAIMGEAAAQVDVTTFHALGLRIVRHWSAELGFRPGEPTVCAGAGTHRLLAEAARGTGVDPEQTQLRRLGAQVDRWRLNAGEPVPPIVRRVAAAYETLLFRAGSVDYPAMLTLPLRLFRAQPAALRFCQDAYRTVLADEFQDLCDAQYTLLRLLAERHRSVVVVGDPRQSLYRWRGADVRYFATFQHDFPGARVLGLEQNFRSTQVLVDLANALGKELGYDCGLWTDNPMGRRALLYGAVDEEDEAAFVAAEIARLLATGAVTHASDMAVLYRTNLQGRTIARALDARGLPHHRPPADPGSAEDRSDVIDGDADEASEHGAARGHGYGVVLTTIHAAKGCEWRVVFVVGLEEGLLPHARALMDLPAGSPISATGEDDEAVDEELRVAYVAVTRPRERLYLTYCRTRQRGPWRRQRRPSRFLDAMSQSLLVAAEPDHATQPGSVEPAA